MSQQKSNTRRRSKQQMINIELMEKQIGTLLGEIKRLKEEDARKSNALDSLIREVNFIKNEFGSLRKKMKTDFQSLESRVNQVKR
jgi:uncharacterized small protein (DUF1192 family)